SYGVYFTRRNSGLLFSTKTQVAIEAVTVNDLFSAIFAKNAELRILPNLWGLFDAIVASSLGYSMCRMRNALPR
ncbi:MAG TPA: hypothetical protein VJZ70_05715, partial [Limnochordia bacterium]|nr:hypothetical protein [Limnochordia bacterium]